MIFLSFFFRYFQRKNIFLRHRAVVAYECLFSGLHDICNTFTQVADRYNVLILRKEHKTIQQKLNRHHKVITKVNRALAEIGRELKIPIKLTTYVARHSYATVLKRAGVPTSIISESLGHSSERVTQIYLDSFENERMNEAMQHLI